MKVLVISEGRHELGRAHEPDERSSLTILVRRIANQEFECEQRKISDPRYRTHGNRAARGKGDPLFKKALLCIRGARAEGYDAVVVLIDQDNEPARHHHFDRAQEDPSESFPRALGVAVKTYDAWMLADEQALSRALAQTIQRLPDPEAIEDPKSRCQQLRQQHRPEIGLTDLYVEVAQTASLEQIEHRCPKGFAVFAERVRRLPTTS